MHHFVGVAGGGEGKRMDANSRSTGFQYELRPQLFHGEACLWFVFLLRFILVSTWLDNSWWSCLANREEKVALLVCSLMSSWKRPFRDLDQSLDIAPEHLVKLHIIGTILRVIYNTIDRLMYLRCPHTSDTDLRQDTVYSSYNVLNINHVPGMLLSIFLMPPHLV